MTKIKGEKPLKVFQHWHISPGVHLAVWRNEGNYSFVVRKRFKNKETGKFETTDTWFLQDLVALQTLIFEAIVWIGQQDTMRKMPSFMDED